MVASSSDDAYCPAPSVNIWWCGTGQCPIFIGNKCILSIRCDGQIKSTRWTKMLRTRAVRIHRRLLNIDNAVYGTWLVQTSQTKKFSTLLLNRGTNTDLRRTRKKLHAVNCLHGPSGRRGRAARDRLWKTNNLLAAAWVCEITLSENLNTRGPEWRMRDWAYRDEYITVISRNQRIIGGYESRIEL